MKRTNETESCDVCGKIHEENSAEGDRIAARFFPMLTGDGTPVREFMRKWLRKIVDAGEERQRLNLPGEMVGIFSEDIQEDFDASVLAQLGPVEIKSLAGELAAMLIFAQVRELSGVAERQKIMLNAIKAIGEIIDKQPGLAINDPDAKDTGAEPTQPATA